MKTVVVADDEFDLLEALRRILEEEGYRVIPCLDGEDAFEKLTQTQADLLIADCLMPRPSGLQLAKQLAQGCKTKDIPVILMSSAGLPKDANSGNIKSFLRKPFSLDRLLEDVKKATDR